MLQTQLRFIEFDSNQPCRPAWHRPNDYPGDAGGWVGSGYARHYVTIISTVGRYDPTQNAEWQRFRQQTIGNSAMLTAKDKVGRTF